MVDVHAQRGREPRDLRAPLLDDAHRADDERRAEHVRPRAPRARRRASRSPGRSCRGPCRRPGSRRRRGRRASAASRGRAPGTGRARTASRRASAAAGSGGRRPGAGPRAARRGRPRRARARPPPSRARETARTSSTIPAPVRRRSRKRSAFSTSDRRSACQRPATRTNGSFAAARSASSCSLRTTSPTASRQSNVASAAVERSPLERAARPLLVAVRLTRSLLGDPSHAPGSSTGTPRASSSGIASRRNSCTSSASSSASAGSASSKRMPCSASSGSISVSCRARSRRGSLARRKREDLVALLVQERGGQPESRIVLGVQPQLEHECRPALVQVEAELPRRRGAAAEAVVEPAGEPPVERRVAGVARQLRLGGARARRGRARARSGGRSAALRRAGRARPAGGRARSGRRGRGRGRARSRRGRRRTRRRRPRGAPAAISSSVACTLSSSVAPQNACQEPPSCSRYGWTRPSVTERCASSTTAKTARRAPAGVRRRRLGEPDQLADVEAPGSRNRPVGVAGEEGRGRVLLPDQFEHDLAM